MKTSLFLSAICLSFLSQAQAPLLPLFKNSSRWHITGWEMGGIFNRGVSHNLSYSLSKDTSINGKNYKSLIRSYKSRDNCLETSCPIEIGKSGIDTLWVRQVDNAAITSKNDTLFAMSGTTVGDSVKLNYQYSKLWPIVKPEYLKITKVEIVDIGSEKVRLFTFGHRSLPIRFFYLDGVGFSTGGPLPEKGYYELAEQMSYLACYQSANSSYSMIWNPVTLTPSSSACSIILSSSEQELATSMKIFLNESNELVHDMEASQIEIVNSMGQLILSNQNTTKTDLNHLKSGVYVAKLAIGTQTKSFRFMIR